jgi:hypothetical protein
MDQIYKLQPHRTMALQGFDDYGAAAALWGASDTGFTVSGVFRDLADFAVLVLFQKDDPFGHPLFSYLPDGDLTGLVLDFDITWQGIQAWESLKSAWTDWNILDYSVNGVGHNDVKWIGTTGITITCNTTGRTGASATFTLNLNSPQAGDKVTLWYQNQSFISPAIIPGNPTTDQALWWQGSVATTDQALWWQGNAAYNHWVKIGSATYSCLEDSLNSAGVANNIAAQINASDPNCSCTTGGAYGNEIFISLRSGKYGPMAVSSSDGSGGATLSNYQHWVQIGSVTYSCYEGSLNSAQIAANVAGQINASDPNCTATVGGQYNNEILITLKSGVAGPIAVSSSDGSAAASLTQGTSAATILNNIASQINGTNWVLNGPAVLSAAVVAPNQLVITATPGADGNMVAFYQTDNNSSARLYFTATNWNLSGGSSDNVSWHVHIDFTALGWNSVDKVWWTIAPALPNSQAYQSTEWKVVVTNWTVTSNPASKRALTVAGPGSVRIEEDSTWVTTSGYWEPAPGNDPVNGAFAFWSQGRAIRAAASGASVTVETHCQYTHAIYVGTHLDTICGIVTATLDGGAPVTLDCYYPTATTSQTRRLLFSGVAAGQHKVVITLSGNKNASSQGWYFYFDFLECAVPSDVPDPVATTTAVAVATDFDTDNTYKLSPQRLVWNIQKLGLLGEIDHYCGVFWWKQSVASNPAYPRCTVTFSGNWNDHDVVWLHIGASAIGKTVFGGQDSSNTIARHFANFINAIFDGVWASVSGSVLTVTSHSFASGWQYHVYTELPASNTGSGHAAVTGDMQGGTYGVKWVIDPTQTPALNRAFRDWNSDFFSLLKANNMSAVCSFSQELVQPPDNPAAGAVWVQRFPDGTAVETATGFGTLNSSQIAFSAGPQSYMGQAFAAMAGLMLAAGLTPKIQFGEILWWFLANTSGMAFHDADTQAAAQSALGRALATFHTPNDDPSVNSYADANFLRTRLYNYVAAIQIYVLSQCPSAVFELLWPMDVNDPDTCKLLRYINLPSQWTTRAGSGFDTFLIEGYQYPGINHNLDQTSRCAAYPWKELAWDQVHCRYLMGLYYGTWPWLREYVNASRLGLPVIKIWAYDHLCLFGWPVPLATTDDRSFIY